MNEIEVSRSLLASVKEIVIKAKQLVFGNSNSILLYIYWKIGRLIVEDEQKAEAKFYLSFPSRDAVRHNLSWTLYRILSRLKQKDLETNILRIRMCKMDRLVQCLSYSS